MSASLPECRFPEVDPPFPRLRITPPVGGSRCHALPHNHIQPLNHIHLTGPRVGLTAVNPAACPVGGVRAKAPRPQEWSPMALVGRCPRGCAPFPPMQTNVAACVRPPLTRDHPGAVAMLEVCVSRMPSRPRCCSCMVAGMGGGSTRQRGSGWDTGLRLVCEPPKAPPQGELQSMSIYMCMCTHTSLRERVK